MKFGTPGELLWKGLQRRRGHLRCNPSGTIESNGTQIYYEMLGTGHPLVLLHGGYMDRRMWDDQFYAFAEHYQVIHYDIRGFGQTPLPQIPYSDRQDLYNLLTSLGIEKAWLLGLSLGGIVVVDFTLDYPEMVDGLILVGSPVSGYSPEMMFTPEKLQRLAAQWEPLAQAIEARDIPSMVECLMAHPTLVPSPEYPAARQRVREQLSAYDFARVLNEVSRDKLQPAACERLAEISAPTLLIMGADDHIQLHRSADKFEQDIANVQRVEIPHTHHMPNMEQPDEFNRVVLDFLEALHNS